MNNIDSLSLITKFIKILIQYVFINKPTTVVQKQPTSSLPSGPNLTKINCYFRSNRVYLTHKNIKIISLILNLFIISNAQKVKLLKKKNKKICELPETFAYSHNVINGITFQKYQ